MGSTRLSGIDSAYLSAETPGNHLHLGAILLLDPSTVPGGHSFAHLREFVSSRLPLVPPLRRRLLEVPLGLDRPRWIEEKELDLDYHLRRAAVPSPGGLAEVAALAAQLNDEPLDRARPLWRMVVAEGLEDGRIALLAKLHHSMMDGVAGVKHMAALLGDSPLPPGRLPGAEGDEPEPPPSDLQLLAEAVPGMLARPMRVTQMLGKTVLGALKDQVSGLMAEPPAPSPPVPTTLFNLRSSPRRSIAYTALPLDDVLGVAHAFDATLNDVVLAIVGSALRDYLLRRGALPETSLMAGFPASIHQEGDDLANAYTLLISPFATHVAEPAARLRAVRDASRHEKEKQRQNVGSSGMMEWADLPPPWFFHAFARLYTGLHVVERMQAPFMNVLVSSVPGPAADLRFAGARVVGLHPLGPIYDGMLLNVTAISLNGSLDIGVVACREGVQGLDEITQHLPRALADLQRELPGADRREQSS